MLTWIVVAFGCVLLCAGCCATGVRIAPTSLAAVGGANAVLVAIGAFLRRSGWRGVADYLEALAQMALATACFTGASYVLAISALPLQDRALEAADGALGIDWRGLIDAFMRLPALVTILNYAYASLGYQMVLVVPVLFLGQGPEGVRFVLAWTVTLAATILVFPLVPALGGYVHNGIGQGDVPLVRIAAAWGYPESLRMAREGALRLLVVSDLDGIVAFPSFHAASAVLLAWSCRRISVLREVMIALNGLMWISSIPIGGHYVVDVLAGSVVACAAIMGVQSVTRPRLLEGARAEGRPALAS